MMAAMTRRKLIPCIAEYLGPVGAGHGPKQEHDAVPAPEQEANNPAHGSEIDVSADFALLWNWRSWLDERSRVGRGLGGAEDPILHLLPDGAQRLDGRGP